MRQILTANGVVPVSQLPAPAEPARRGLLKRLGAALGGGLLAGLFAPSRAVAGTNSADPYIGEIMLFAGNFPPRGYLFCQGQLLSIAQNTALFSILGTTYGGNGQTTFALPDLRGRFPLQQGTGPGLPSYQLGEMDGSPTRTLLITQMPAHNHGLNGSTQPGNSSSPTGTLLADNGAGGAQYYDTPLSITQMHPNSVGVTGGSQPFSIMPPFLGINFCIAMEGVYPPRN